MKFKRSIKRKVSNVRKSVSTGGYIFDITALTSDGKEFYETYQVQIVTRFSLSENDFNVTFILKHREQELKRETKRYTIDKTPKGVKYPDMKAESKSFLENHLKTT